MLSDWMLNLEEASEGGVRIVAVKGEERCVLSRALADDEELAAEVERLRKDLERLTERGRDLLAEQREREKGSDPASIWREMEALADEEEMVAYFNSLSNATRTRVAEHVLTRVSAFKGMAPRFAVRFNRSTNLLE